MSYNPYANDENPYAQANDNPYTSNNPYANANSNEEYEMNAYNNTTNHAATDFSGQDFFSKIQTLKDDIADYNGLINQLETLQVSALNAVSAEELNAVKAQIDNTTANLRDTQGSEIKPRLEDLFKSCNGDKDKEQQVENIRNQFRNAIQRFAKVDDNYKESNQNRAIEQYQIVNPDATYDQAYQFVDSIGDEHVFDQAIQSANRKGEAIAVLDEVKTRHQEVLRAVQLTSELNALLNDLQDLVFQQDEMLNTANKNIEIAQTQMERGDANVIKARDHAKKGRKWRWILFWVVVVLICAIVGGVVGGVVGSRN
jgi:syntaxin 1B/2/3